MKLSVFCILLIFSLDFGVAATPVKAKPAQRAQASTSQGSVHDLRLILNTLPKDSAEEIQLIRKLGPAVYFLELVAPDGDCKAYQYSVVLNSRGRWQALSLAREFPCEGIGPAKPPGTEDSN